MTRCRSIDWQSFTTAKFRKRFNLTKIYMYKASIFTLMPYLISFSNAFYIIFAIRFGLFSPVERKISKQPLHNFDHPTRPIILTWMSRDFNLKYDIFRKNCNITVPFQPLVGLFQDVRYLHFPCPWHYVNNRGR